MTIHSDNHPSGSNDETKKEQTIGLGAAAQRELTTLITAMYQVPTREWLGRHLSGERAMHGLHWSCGSGEFTFLIASLLEEKSTVWGIDADPVLIDVARREQNRRAENRVRFEQDDPALWQSEPTYDFIYTRFRASALPDQGALLQRLWRRLNPGSYLLAEVLSFSGFNAYPYNHAFGRAAELIGRLEETPDGRRQYWRELFQQAGFTDMEIACTPPAFLPREHNRILSLALEFFREVLLRRRLAAREELNALLLELRQYEQQEDTLICRPGVHLLLAGKI